MMSDIDSVGLKVNADLSDSKVAEEPNKSNELAVSDECIITKDYNDVTTYIHGEGNNSESDITNNNSGSDNSCASGITNITSNLSNMSIVSPESSVCTLTECDSDTSEMQEIHTLLYWLATIPDHTLLYWLATIPDLLVYKEK